MNNESILITGGTGSFGNKFVSMTLKKFNPKRIVIFSRDEMKQWEMAQKFDNDKRVSFLIGDVRDKERLYRAINGVDYVIHAAATKIVPTAEHDPFECIKTNILGAMNLIDACIDKKVKRVVALSTDKASNTINLYGATKLASDKLFISANSNKLINKQTIFSVVRYGNVMNSRGSVIPFFQSLKDKTYLPITHKDMTRFMITLDDALDLVFYAIKNVKNGQLFFKKSPSTNLRILVKAIFCKI